MHGGDLYRYIRILSSDTCEGLSDQHLTHLWL